MVPELVGGGWSVKFMSSVCLSFAWVVDRVYQKREGAKREKANGEKL